MKKIIAALSTVGVAGALMVAGGVSAQAASTELLKPGYCGLQTGYYAGRSETFQKEWYAVGTDGRLHKAHRVWIDYYFSFKDKSVAYDCGVYI